MPDLIEILMKSQTTACTSSPILEEVTMMFNHHKIKATLLLEQQDNLLVHHARPTIEVWPLLSKIKAAVEVVGLLPLLQLINLHGIVLTVKFLTYQKNTPWNV